MVEHGKPVPDLFLHAAKAAGMRVICFVGGTHAKRPAHRAALLEAAPGRLIDDMTGLLAIADSPEG
jgi:beta-phosphoglucomutase-like phosphatase (HAD superfamily)